MRLIWTLLLILTGCSGFSLGPQPYTWFPTDFNYCSVDLDPSLTDLPYDVGFTILNTQLPYGRYDSQSSMRPKIIHAHTQAIEDISLGSIDNPKNTGSEFLNFYHDARTVYFSKCWEDPQNGMIEQLVGEFRYSAANYLCDTYSYDRKTGIATNLTAIDRVSYYNGGALETSANQLTFGALIGNESTSFIMNLDGNNKHQVIQIPGFNYGFTYSPDKTQYSYHSDYRLVIGDATTNVQTQVNTSYSFNFQPTWSPDSSHIAFFCGASNIGPDICIVDRTGQNVRLLASRNGYSGAYDWFDGIDFHGGSSDNLVFSSDSSKVYYAASVINGTELYSIDINTNAITQLTYSPYGSMNFRPALSPNGSHLLHNKKVNGIRQLYYLDLITLIDSPITNLKEGCGALYGMFGPDLTF